VFEERGRRNRWERLKSETQDRWACQLSFVLQACLCDFAFSLWLPCRVMEKASAAMHSKLNKAQKDESLVSQTRTKVLSQTQTHSKLLYLLQAKRKLEEYHGRAHERHVIAMNRMAQKHAREVQIALEIDRVEKEGELRQQTRIARQSTVELVKVQVEQIGLREQLQVLEKEHNVMVKTIGRERRQHDVDRQTLHAIPSA
jgi:hypothetical protein